MMNHGSEIICIKVLTLGFYRIQSWGVIAASKPRASRNPERQRRI